MPGLDGLQALAALQELNPTVVCCFMTGHAGDYTEADLVEQGAARVFAKPFALGELRSYLQQRTTTTGPCGA
jgi:CheY-like chemotaxis protein